ncbi:hypothetical protein ES703_41637 [subsurface metagenome]
MCVGVFVSVSGYSRIHLRTHSLTHSLADSPIMSGFVPLLGLDVWEHVSE